MMIRQTAFSLLTILLVLVLSNNAQASVQLYSGRMEILVTSGKTCEGLAKTYDVSLAFTEEDGVVNGYFIGSGITIGKISGTGMARLDVRYPFQEELRATGHVMSLSRSDTMLVAELSDRHIDADAEDCNFDRARMELTRSVTGDAAAQMAQMTGLFDAQLNRSRAVSLVKSKGYEAALPHFERALVLADTFLAKDSDQLISYIVGLATSYIWLKRHDDFNRLFDTRITNIQDESVRSIFSGYRVRNLMNAGKSALGREEFEPALKLFEQACNLQPRNRDAIAAVMSVYVRSKRYTEAATFLERVESLQATDAERKDIRSATAIVLFKKAQQDDKDGLAPEAETALKRAMELDPDSIYSLIALARLRHKAGSLADAESLLDQGMERFTDVQSQKEIAAAREKMVQTELFLKKIRKAGS
jgi:tetratricopeptide (TPR) repeat protein